MAAARRARASRTSARSLRPRRRPRRRARRATRRRALRHRAVDARLSEISALGRGGGDGVGVCLWLATLRRMLRSPRLDPSFRFPPSAFEPNAANAATGRDGDAGRTAPLPLARRRAGSFFDASDGAEVDARDGSLRVRAHDPGGVRRRATGRRARGGRQERAASRRLRRRRSRRCPPDATLRLGLEAFEAFEASGSKNSTTRAKRRGFAIRRRGSAS